MLRKAKNILCNIHSVKIPEFHISTKANERRKIREQNRKRKWPRKKSVEIIIIIIKFEIGKI